MEDPQALFDKTVIHLYLPLSHYYGMKILTLKLKTQRIVSLRPSHSLVLFFFFDTLENFIYFETIIPTSNTN